MNPRDHNQRLSRRGYTAWGILLILSLIWGSSFILIKKSLLAFSPEEVGSARIAISFLAFTPLFFYQLKRIDWTKFWPLLVVGLFGSALPAFLYATAQTQIPSAIAGLLNALTPIFAFILSVMAFGKSFSWQQLLGITLGFAGTAIIFFSQNEVSGDFPLLMGFLLVLATFCYGISANTVSSFLGTIHPLIISTVSFVMIGPWMLIYLLQTDFITHINTHEHSHISLLALMTLSLVGTFGANIIFFRLVQLTDAVFASSVSFLVPIVAFGWGVLDGESFSLAFFIALILIFTGVFLVKFKKDDRSQN